MAFSPDGKTLYVAQTGPDRIAACPLDAAGVPAKDFAKGFTDLVGKLKDSGATFIVTIDLSKLPKDLIGSLNDLADCVVELSKDDSDPNGRQLKVQRLNQKSAKIDAETFEIDSSKGLVFV